VPSCLIKKINEQKIEMLVELMKIATFGLLREVYGEKGNYIQHSLSVTSGIFSGLEGLNGGGCRIRWDYFAKANM